MNKKLNHFRNTINLFYSRLKWRTRMFGIKNTIRFLLTESREEYRRLDLIDEPDNER